MDKEKLYHMLLDNAALEQKEFLERMKALPPEEIIGRAYEITLRNDIVCILENEDFSRVQLKTLAKVKQPVGSLYDEWISSDYSHMQDIRDCTYDFIDSLIKSDKELQRQKKRNELSR